MKHSSVFIVLLLLFAVAAAGGQSLLDARASDFALSDQYDRHYSLQSLSGRPFVLIASDKRGTEQNHEWGMLIRGKYGYAVRALGVADVRSVPFFLKGKIRNDFKKDPNSILLDWQGIIFKAYGLAKGLSNVVLIDNNGYVRYVYAGGPTREAGERLFREIEGALHGKEE
jgi:hypothetical protein